MIESPVTILMNANDIVDGLENNDEKIFLFIWEMLDNENVGVEVKQRMLRSLDGYLRDTGNHPDDEDKK